VRVETLVDLRDRVAAKQGAPVKITVVRDGKKQDVEVTPKRSFVGLPYKPESVLLMGIVPIAEPDIVKVSTVDAAGDALTFPVDQTKLIVGAFRDIFAGREEADPGGPVRIASEFSKAWKAGFRSGIELLMMLSVYLGLFNLFPLPALDGGRLVFLTYELVTRRRANPKIEAMVHMGGIMVLGVVMILVTLNDFHVF
jgi:regulator of sigma E protease